MTVVDDIARAMSAVAQSPLSQDAAKTLEAALARGTRADALVARTIAGGPRPPVTPVPHEALAAPAPPAGPLPVELPASPPPGPGPLPTAPAILMPQTNFGKNVRMDVAKGFSRVVTRGCVHRAIQNAIASNEPNPLRRGVRAVGASHSSSRVVDTSSTVAQPSTFEVQQGPPAPPPVAGELHDVSRLRPEWYRLDPQHLAMHVAVGAGNRVKEVNAKLAGVGLALPMTGAYTNQTFVGALCTGTHGSGSAFGPLHALVRSIQLVTTDGAHPIEHRIERTAGITNGPAYLKDNPTVKLVQEDGAFRAALVGLGSFGYVTSLIIEVGPAFHLSREHTLSDWDEVRAMLTHVDRNGWPSIFAGTYSAGVLFNPYPWPLWSLDPSGHGKRKALITKMYETEQRPPNAKDPTSGPSVPGFVWDVARTIANSTALTPEAIEFAVEQAGGTALEWGPSHAMLGDAGNLPAGYSIEIAFPLSSYLAGIDAVLDAMLSLARAQRKMTLGTVSVRYVRADDAYVSMAEGTDTVFMEILTLAGIDAAPDVFAAIEATALAHKGRPHWGQVWTLERLPAIAGHYPHFRDWRDQMKRFDPTGFFANDFVRRVFQLP